MSKPITFLWTDNGVMVPFGIGMSKKADEEFTVGEYYRLVELEERSRATHAHYFATLHDMWMSLPEHIRIEEDWAESEDTLRKFALIKTGFYDEKVYACETAGEAKRVAKWVVPADYAIIIVKGNLVRVFTAKSQSYKAMPEKGQFQRSKEAVLNFVADILALPKDAEQRKTQ
jgi:hypothetical protein